MTSNPFEKFVELYAKNPVGFVREVLGADPLPYQCELMEAVVAGERKISVRSGHGTGKSSCASWVMLHYLLFNYPCKIVVTAPTSGQLFDALFAELRRWISELPPALAPLLNVKSDRVELVAAPSEAFISARTSRAETPEALAGVHSDNVLLVVDEASAVPEPVYEAAAGSMSGHTATTLLLSNPTRTSGTFFDTHNRLAGSWWTRRWSCIESPLVSDEFVDEMRERYGEDSNAFKVRVKGDFPASDDDVLIPYHLIEEATTRDIAVDLSGGSVWGLDPARFGSDRTALCKRTGGVVTELTSWRQLDTMATVGRVKAEYDALPPSARPAEIMVDSIGIGAGVVDRLRELGLPVRGVNVSESPAMGQTYANLRAELWNKTKGWLEARACKIPKDEGLVAELSSVRYTFTSSGKMQIESKEQMKRRGLHSPDLADSLVLTMAGDAATALGVGRATWAKPIKRNLQGIA
jgi:phage terminase large subunit